MKKIFTLIAAALMGLAASAQEPLYTFQTTVTNDATWGDEYANSFAFQGTKVTVEVYAEDYVIIRNWAGAEGCDLKVEYDASADLEADDCYGNILALTAYINGDEQTPLTYSKDYEGNTYNYVDLATGRADYSVASTWLNEDGTFYWSFVEVDKENKTGYVQLSAYFMTADYSDYLPEEYYFVEWPEAAEPEGPVFYGTFTNGETGAVLDEDGNVDTEWGTAFLTGLTDITVDVYDEYVLIHDYCKNAASPRDLKITCSHDENQNMTSATYINGDKETSIPAAGNIYTGFDATNGDPYMTGAYVYTNGYSLADWDETGGYIILTGYPYYKDAEGNSSTGALGYYYLYWGYDDDDAIAAIQSHTPRTAAYNLSGQRVTANYKGIVLKNGKKTVIK